jgi:hypothetical protein
MWRVRDLYETLGVGFKKPARPEKLLHWSMNQHGQPEASYQNGDYNHSYLINHWRNGQCGVVRITTLFIAEMDEYVEIDRYGSDALANRTVAEDFCETDLWSQL